MSKYGLVEAEEIPGADDAARAKFRRGRQAFRTRTPRGRSRGTRGDSAGRDGSYMGNIYVPDTPETREYITKSAVAAFEAHFSVDFLCQDTFLRSYMDEAGFVPIAFICNFPSVAYFGADYHDIIEELKKSEQLEIDEENECVRLKENWEVWLFPNGQGGRGLPRYVKQPEAFEDGAHDLDGEEGHEVEPAAEG